MKNSFDPKKYFDFCEKYEKKNSLLVLLYIIISFGFYIIKWFYDNNKIFEEIDSEAPDSRRGAIILLILPLTWYIINFIINRIIFLNNNSLILNLFEFVGWSFIIYLSLQYFYDFCSSFARITLGSGIFWYLLIYPGYFSIIFYFTNIFPYWFLLFFPVLTIFVMQAILNKIVDETYKKEIKKVINYRAKSGEN